MDHQGACEGDGGNVHGRVAGGEKTSIFSTVTFLPDVALIVTNGLLLRRQRRQ